MLNPKMAEIFFDDLTLPPKLHGTITPSSGLRYHLKKIHNFFIPTPFSITPVAICCPDHGVIMCEVVFSETLPLSRYIHLNFGYFHREKV